MLTLYFFVFRRVIVGRKKVKVPDYSQNLNSEILVAPDELFRELF